MSSLTRRGFAASLVAGSLAACGGFAARAAAPDRLRIGFLPLVSHAPTFIAAGKGYFAAHGFAPELVSFQAAEPVAAGIAAGDIDFSTTAITGGLISLADKGAIVVIGGALQEAPGIEGQKILASKKAYASGLTTPAKLKGRSFGITTAGSSFQYMAHKIAQKEGFPDSAIELRPLQKIPILIAALASGQIDAWSIQPNIADHLTRNGSVVEIGRIADFAPNYQVTTVFTSTANARQRPELVKRFLAAYSQGVADYNAALVEKTMGKDETAAIVALLHKYVYSSQPLDQADPLIRAGAMRINPGARLNLASVKDQLGWFLAERLVPPGVTIDKLVDPGFVASD